MIIEGFVERGKHLGRALGFPTLNVHQTRALGPWPENGVYAAAVWVAGEAQAYPGMLNQGVHPTVPEGKPTIEVHLIGLDMDLYGVPVRVEYLRFLRLERRFESLDALTAQLGRDREATLAWLCESLAADNPSPEQLRARAIDWHPGTL